MYRTLKDELQNGRYVPGTRLPSESELMGRFGASRSTVIRALRDLKRDGDVIGRQGAGNYVAEFLTGTAKVKTTVIGVLSELTPGHDAPCMLTELQLQLGILAQRDGATVVIERMPRGESPLAASDALLGRRVDAVFVLPVEVQPGMPDVNAEIISRFERAGVPVVLLDRDVVEYPNRSRFDLVCGNHRLMGFRATDYLLSRGCRRVAFVGVDAFAPAVTERRFGYLDAMRKHGIEPDPAFYANDGTDDLDQALVARVMRDAQPDAVICKSDKFAARFMGGLIKLGVSVPGDVQLMGIGDEPFSQFLPVPLTTVRVPVADLAEAAWRIISERLHNAELAGRLIQVNCSVIERETTR
jgi:DNA-binding LacI/PurR family transcriptional regulator